MQWQLNPIEFNCFRFVSILERRQNKYKKATGETGKFWKDLAKILVGLGQILVALGPDSFIDRPTSSDIYLAHSAYHSDKWPHRLTMHANSIGTV